MTDSEHPDLLEIDPASGETVLDVYERNGWGDGLPLEAPTPERVDAMLRTLDLVDGRPVDPDEVLVRAESASATLRPVQAIGRPLPAFEAGIASEVLGRVTTRCRLGGRAQGEREELFVGRSETVGEEVAA